MLYGSESYAFQLGEVCFPTRGSMLSDLGMYAFRLGDVCFLIRDVHFRLEIYTFEKCNRGGREKAYYTP